jgi:hypothetical protein
MMATIFLAVGSEIEKITQTFSEQFASSSAASIRSSNRVENFDY